MRVYLRTFGCRANQYDTEAVRTMLASGGYEVVESVQEADAAVFNTCAVTASAEAELRKVVRQAARRRPELRSIVMGCASALERDRPIERRLGTLPTVDHVIAGADLPAIAKALDLPVAVSAVLTERQRSTRALLRIQDGCDEHCTFCATTMARGANRSRPVDELVHEASVLAEHHPEIVITGIHIGTYGADIGTSLAALMTRLVRDVAAVRFRLSSIEATEVDDVLLALFAGMPERLVPHVHAPLQSGSDRVLRRMGRHWYTSATYADAIERLAATMSVLGLGADVITGFPGERDEDHAATMRLVDRLPFTYLHVFPYSVRPGTPSERLPDQVTPSVAGARAAEIRALARDKASAYLTGRIGGQADVIVIGGAGAREGLTGDYLSVLLADPARPRGDRYAARLVSQGNRVLAYPAD